MMGVRESDKEMCFLPMTRNAKIQAKTKKIKSKIIKVTSKKKTY